MTVLRPQPVPAGPESTLPLLPREDPITRLPILILYPHSRCNCRCRMCDIWRAKERDELGAAQIEAWREEWRALGVRRVVLSGGEALLHSHLWELCALLRELDIGITLLTTGLLLERDAGKLVEYCDDVIVSLDGPQPIHDSIRSIPGAFEKLARGVAAVRKTGASVSVSGRCTVQRDNFLALRATVAAARAIHLDRISFLAADVSSEAFNRPEGWAPERVSQVALQVEDLPLLESELECLEGEHAADFASGYIAESPLKLRRRLLQYFTAIAGKDDFYPNTCNAPWVSTVIEANGTVRPCFFQPPLGSIHEAGSLDAVLNSPAAIAFRQRLDVRTDPLCRRCVCTLALRAPSQPASPAPN